MSLEGSLAVRLAWDGRRVRHVSVQSTRPLAAPRVLAGRAIGEAAAMLPRLYGVCAFAQGAAGASAMTFAAALRPPAALMRARDLAVALETLQEDLRRLLIELPGVAGIDPRVEAVAAARRALAPILAALRPTLDTQPQAYGPNDDAIADVGARLRAIVERDLVAMDAAAFDALATAADCRAWAQAARTPAARVVDLVLAQAPGLGASDVPSLPEAAIHSVLAGVHAALEANVGFAGAPQWQGAPAETGALARGSAHRGLAAFVAEYGAGVAARVLARTLEAARTVVALAEGRIARRIEATAPRAEVGVAGVQTARGLLVHRARVVAGRIADYAIVAPTEWNFHPQGALVRSLERLAANDEHRLARDAHLVVQSLDPCVACRVEIGHA